MVVGCGNLLRGDDGVGPIVIRELWEGLGGLAITPGGVELVDGGTAGMDVAFKMRGVRRVIVIDAAATGAEPGTVFEVPGQALEDLPPLEGLHTHLFRWDHALAFARWLLKDEYPTDITVLLVEAVSVGLGDPLSEPARRGLDIVKQRIIDDVLGSDWSQPDPAVLPCR
ncbi:MAG: hydrogenase maturation protease [Actinomycetota bacterium]|uniref:hydrogenase maturation protease n=1 Tax=Euzebya rosea TaxID=2052804 RepID=UPI00196B3FC4|nr:hydrogenase maturation protease [Euzebya rosea]